MDTPSQRANKMMRRLSPAAIFGGCAALALAGACAVAWQLGADPIEVLAIALYAIPITGAATGMVAYGAAGGLIAGGIYAVSRIVTLPGIPPEMFATTMVLRLVMFMAVGTGGALLYQTLLRTVRSAREAHVDPVTGTANVRAAVEMVRREQARAQRYGSEFSIVQVHLSPDVIAADPNRSHEMLRELGQVYAASVRSTDEVAHVPASDGGEDFILILPETGVLGAHTMLERAVQQGREKVAALATPDKGVDGEAWTVPGAEEWISAMTESWSSLPGATSA